MGVGVSRVDIKYVTSWEVSVRCDFGCHVQIHCESGGGVFWYDDVKPKVDGLFVVGRD